MRISRREFLRDMAVLTGLAATANITGCVVPTITPAAEELEQELEPVTFRLNWKITGPHAAYYLGAQRGFYEEEGLDLQIMEGSGSGPAAELVGNKSDTFGLADAAAVIPFVVKGLPIKCVGMVSPRTSLAVVAREDSGIKTIKDVEGKTLAVTPGDALTQIWPAVVAANNLDASTINLVNVDAAAKIPVVLENKADALLGAASDQPFILEAEGVPAVALPFPEYGVNVLNLGIWVHNDSLGEMPDTIRAFLKATQRSLEAVQEETDAAVDLLVEAKPEIDPTVASNQSRAYMEQFGSPNCPDAALLYNCPEDWEQTLEIMTTYRELETDMKAEDFYTNEFLPS